ncbi:MAG: GFA family protein [Deltaproteobacteria bacterium]|nr:GFA family protein [Deltaproteobacteria bacterium]
MTKHKKGQGTCLCGAVTVIAPEMKTTLSACHCGTCRTWCAGPFLAVGCGSNVEIIGQDHLSVYSSSDWAQRGFCQRCGSSLFYRLKATNQYFVSSEIFHETAFAFDLQVFTDEKPTYYAFSNPTKNMTSDEVLAAFSSST